MKLRIKALAIAGAILWGGAVFLTGLANMTWAGYAEPILKLIASVYPGYGASGSFGDLIVGTLYSLADGAVGGLIFGWLYNRFTGSK